MYFFTESELRFILWEDKQWPELAILKKHWLLLKEDFKLPMICLDHIAQCKLYLGLLLIEPSSCQDLIQAEIYLKEALVMQSNVYSECERELISNSSLSLEIFNTIKTDWLLVYFNLQVSNFGNRKVLPSKTGSMIQSIKTGLSSLIYQQLVLLKSLQPMRFWVSTQTKKMWSKNPLITMKEDSYGLKERKTGKDTSL